MCRIVPTRRSMIMLLPLVKIGETTDKVYNISLISYCGVTSFGEQTGGYFDTYVNQQLIGFQIGDSLWGVQELPTTLIDIQVNSELHLFPNPTNNIIYTDFTIINPLRYSIYNLQGQIIQDGILTENYLSVSDLTCGVYILELRNTENIFRGKFMKE